MKHRLDTTLETWADMLEYESTLTCGKCHEQWRGHARVKSEDGDLIMLVSVECPTCGPEMRLTRVSGDPERIVIRGGKR